MDETTPVLSRVQLRERLGGVPETRRIVNAYDHARRERLRCLKELEQAYVNKVVGLEIPYTEEGWAEHSWAITNLHEAHRAACEKERVERVATTRQLELCAPWARDMGTTRALLQAHYKKYPREGSFEWRLMERIATFDTIDLGDLIGELVD